MYLYEKIEKAHKIILIALHIYMIAIFLAMIIKYYTDFSEIEYIWFCSKILTVKKMIKNNNKIIRPFSRIFRGERYYYTEIYYMDLLERTSRGECLNDFKKCGIVDTYGNPICFPQGSECPTNKIIFDLTSKLSLYQENNYDYYPTDNSNLYFYYKRRDEESGIIAQWKSGNSQPKYIDDDNFKFDIDAFYECFGRPDDDDDDDDYDDDDDDDDDDSISAEIIAGSIDFAGDLIQNAVKLERIKKLLDYIDKKINEEANIDYNFTYINYNQYVKNYMGFENLEAAEDFNKIDFDAYKSRYPNYASVISAIIFLIAYFIFMIVVIIIFIKGGEISPTIIIITIILYIPVFLGFWIYSIVIYAKDFKNGSFEIAKRIRADKYIEDFLEEFYSPFEKTGFIISIIIFLTFSLLIFISLFAIGPIIECIEKRKTTSSDRIIVYSNQNNARAQQNMNDNYNNRQYQLSTENNRIDINRVSNTNMRQNEANKNQPEKKDEVGGNNQKSDELKINENNLGNQNQEFNTVAVEENNKQ